MGFLSGAVGSARIVLTAGSGPITTQNSHFVGSVGQLQSP